MTNLWQNCADQAVPEDTSGLSNNSPDINDFDKSQTGFGRLTTERRYPLKSMLRPAASVHEILRCCDQLYLSHSKSGNIFYAEHLVDL